MGAALSSRHKRHFLDQQDAMCKCCGSNDDYSHPLRFCPQFAAARSQVPQALLETLDDETLLRGLWSEPPEGVAAKLQFDAIPHPDVFEFTSFHVCLFTDGSTHPDPFFPISAWSVVFAEPDSFENAVVERGILPGRQDNYRAELYAAYVAVQCAESATLFSDNLAVVLGFQVLFSRGWVSSRFLQQAQTALWWELWLCLAPKRERWRFCHVKSHTKPQQNESFAQKWARRHNATADQTAINAHALRSPELCEAANAARKAYASTVRTAKCAFALQEAIVRGQGSVPETSETGPPVAPVGATTVPSSHQLVQQGARLNFNFQPHDFPDALLGPRFIWVVQAWMLHAFGFSLLNGYPSWSSNCILWLLGVGLALLMLLSYVLIGCLPPSLQIGSIPQAFVPVTNYASLALSMPPIGKQTTIFLQALKYTSKRLNLGLIFKRKQSLQPFACTDPVASMCTIPKNIRGQSQELLNTFFSWPGILGHHENCSQNPIQTMACPVPLRDPTVVWNEYTKLAKAARRRRNA